MSYYISYKGKKLGMALTKQEAEEKLLVLSRCFQQLEVIQEKQQPTMAPLVPGKMLAKTK